MTAIHEGREKKVLGSPTVFACVLLNNFIQSYLVDFDIITLSIEPYHSYF